MKEGPKDFDVAIFTGMCEDVRIMMQKERFVAAIILMFSAIDALGIALRQNSKQRKTGADFKEWVTRFLKLTGEIPTPEELWLHRCAILHNYGVSTAGHSKGNHRIITFGTNDNPRCFTRTIGNQTIVFINIDSFHDAFQTAIQNSLVDAMESEEWRDTVLLRLKEFVQPIQLDEEGVISTFLSGN